jgi:hypothetical protein
MIRSRQTKHVPGDEKVRSDREYSSILGDKRRKSPMAKAENDRENHSLWVFGNKSSDVIRFRNRHFPQNVLFLSEEIGPPNGRLPSCLAADTPVLYEARPGSQV